jgi:hypothetical protein
MNASHGGLMCPGNLENIINTPLHVSCPSRRVKHKETVEQYCWITPDANHMEHFDCLCGCFGFYSLLDI